MDETKKRKTHTSSEVKKRYNDKTYQRYQLNLRKVEDADLIERIEKEKASGFTTTEAIKKLIK
jgi:plasmid rolling circle replication initiator protein Rep